MVTMLKRMGGSLLAGWSEWPKGGWVVKAAKITNPGLEGRGEEIYHCSNLREAYELAYSLPREWPIVSVWQGNGWRGEGMELPPFRCSEEARRYLQRLVMVRGIICVGEGVAAQRLFVKAAPYEVLEIMKRIEKGNRIAA